MPTPTSHPLLTLGPLVTTLALGVGCRCTPCDALRKRPLIGTPIEAFVARESKPIAIVDHADGSGRTYTFETVQPGGSTSRQSPLYPGFDRVPGYLPVERMHQSPRLAHPPAPSGHPQVYPGTPQIFLGAQQSPGTWVRSSVIRIHTNPQGIIEAYSCLELP